MYICLCNGLTDRDVKAAVSSGARRIANVYEMLGAAPQCAKCSLHIRDIIRETTEVGVASMVRR